MRKKQTMKFMKENIIAIDQKDKQVWEILVDVPKMGTPFQYVALLLNVIIPGK